MSPATRSRLGRRPRPRHGHGVTAAALSAAVLVAAALALSALGVAAADDIADICLEGGADAPAPMLMLDWTTTGETASSSLSLMPGCACELLPDAAADGNSDDSPNDAPEPTTAPTVRPGETRVFRLLHQSARLACSGQCGRVVLSNPVDGQEWVLAPGEKEGLAVRRRGGCRGDGGAVAGFAWGGGESTEDGATLLHALSLRADASDARPPQQQQTSILTRAAALLLFVGLNVAAAALSSSSSSSSSSPPSTR